MARVAASPVGLHCLDVADEVLEPGRCQKIWKTEGQVRKGHREGRLPGTE